jgi:hypothetical protein
MKYGFHRAMGVIEINQTADPGAFLVGARSRFFGHYSIFLGFSTSKAAGGGTFLVYIKKFNHSPPDQIVHKRSLVEWLSLCSEGPGFDTQLGRKSKKKGTLEGKRPQKVDFALKARSTLALTSVVGKRPRPASPGCGSLVEGCRARLTRQRLNTYSKGVDRVQSNRFLHFNPSHRPKRTLLLR